MLVAIGLSVYAQKSKKTILFFRGSIGWETRAQARARARFLMATRFGTRTKRLANTLQQFRRWRTMASRRAIPLGVLRKDVTTMKPNKLHSLVVACLASFNASQKTERADYNATLALLKAVPLNDAEAVKTVRDDLFATFGEEHKDAAQIRVNILNNARRVAFGGTKDGKAVRGKGQAVMLEVAASVASVRELRKAMSEAVPEALKGASGGDKRSDKAKGKGKPANPLSVPKVATREEAFAAARKILEFVRDKFTKPSETDIFAKINACVEVLK